MGMRLQRGEERFASDKVCLARDPHRGACPLKAWHKDNLTTDKELTIKEEGRPPWAGCPKGLAVYPWPPSEEDE